MPILEDYHHFAGTHWETGSVHNFYAYRKTKAPHTGKPYSEALLLGISGGIVTGYFTFAYEGYDSQCNILTRNTFDPLQTLLSRLGVVQEIERTASAQTAVATLADTLAEGIPAIVWADIWCLPYNAMTLDEGMFGMAPILVYGLDPDAGAVYIADRARVPLVIALDELAAARSRVKKEKHRQLTLDAPDPDKLPAAVRLGIWDAIKLFTEKPPKGSQNNFGLAALRYWAKMLVSAAGRSSWEAIFPQGPKLYAGLTSAFYFAFLFGKGLAVDAERSTYADFLDEAALILANPDLGSAAHAFRASAACWRELPGRLLPDTVPLFAEARSLMWRRHERFLQKGQGALDEMHQIDSRLAAIRQVMEEDFPLSQSETTLVKQGIAEQLMAIHEAEATAIQALQSVMR